VGPRRLEGPLPPHFQPTQQLEIWSKNEARTLHAVVQRGDSLYGIPLRGPISCDSCRVGFALGDIDSVRAVSTDRSALLTQGLVLGFAAAALVAWRIAEGD
jgi:hypothetical protein